MHGLLRRFVGAGLLGLFLTATTDGSAAEPAASAPKDSGVLESMLKKRARPSEHQGTPEDTVKSSAELVPRARAALRELEHLSSRARVSPELEKLAETLPGKRNELATRVTAARADIRRSRRGSWVRDIRFSFLEERKRIDEWQLLVKEASDGITAASERTAKLVAFWQRASDLTRQADVPPELRERTASVVLGARRTELALARPEAFVIPLQTTLAEMSELVDSVLRDAHRNRPDLLKDATERDLSIVGVIRGLWAIDDLGATLAERSRSIERMGALFVSANRRELAAHFLFLVVVLFGMMNLRARSSDWAKDERQGLIARRLVAHPIATSLLVTTVATGMFYDAMPTAALLVVNVVAVASALVLFPKLLDQRLRLLSYTLGAFVVLDVLRLFVIEVVPLERGLLTLELVVATLLIGLILRRKSWLASPFAESWASFYRAVAYAWAFGAGVGALAALFGYGAVAEILGGGVLVSMYLALIFAAAFAALGSVLWILTHGALAERLNFVRRDRTRVVAFFLGVLRWVALVLWVHFSLRFLTLAGVAWRAVLGVLSASLEVGSLKISVGDVAVLVVGATLALYVARFLRFLLDEDIFPRLSIREGTRQIASLSVYYVVLLLGLFFTLAAGGIALDRITVLAGALGVGIGFGLQNVVQNFVSGLILLFGGSIKIGDKIQIADLVGEVRSLGFRASTVRTGQGAEVIVPNSKLIADQVINWTLSDPKRRVEVDIGVGYGSEPARVMTALCEVAAAHPNVLKDPAPLALFLRHGPSSLDFQLQAWVAFDDHPRVKSELTTGINARLTAEKIPIPYPQHDLRVAAVEPRVIDALRGLSGKSV